MVPWVQFWHETLRLTSAGALDLSSLTLTGTISGTAAGAVALAGSLGDYSGLKQTANGAFSVTSSSDMVVSGGPNRANNVTGDISYIVTGAGKTLTIASGGVNFGANNVTLGSDTALVIDNNVTTTRNIALNSGAGISGTGKITAATLNVTAADAVNVITNVTNLGGVTVTNSKNFTLTNDGAVTIIDNVTASGGVVNIVAGGRITTDSDKKITALTVSGSATDAVDIKTNVTNLGAFTVTGNKNFTLTNDGALTVTSAVNIGSGRASFVGGGASANQLSINADVTAGSVELDRWSVVNGTGKIIATNLSGKNITDHVTLNTNIANLKAFAVTNKNLTLVNDGALTVSEAVSVGTGNISLTATTGAIAINAAVSGADVSLTASGTGGAISQTAKITATGVLAAAATNAVALNGVNDNAITKLGAISGSGVTINNAVALTLTGNITTTGGGAITINNSFGAAAANKAMTLGANININGGNIVLDLGGGTHAATHAAGTGGAFATGNNLLKTYTGGDTANASNITILADSFTYGTGPNFDVGSAKISTVAGTLSYLVNDKGAMVVGGAYNDYAASQKSYTNALVGADLDATKVSGGAGSVVATLGLTTDLNFGGDIYINEGATQETNFRSITSTGGRVYFVGGAGYTVANNLIVSAAKGITINSIVNVAANKLTLTTARGGVVGSGVITAGTLTTQNDAAIASVTGSGVVGGINLSGSNLISAFGDLSNSGGGNISITNGQTANVASGSTWSNKNGMIIVKLTTGNLNLLGDMTVASGTTALRVDLGSSANITSSTGTNTISGKGVDVYFSGKSDGNGVNFKLGETVAAVGNNPGLVAGVFTHVIDKTPTQGNSQTIDKLYSLTGDASNFLILGGTSGITIYNNAGVALATQPAVGKGLRFRTTDAVTIDGNWPAVTAANAATNPGTLRWIEGGTINVKSNTSFAGSIVLAATGSPTTPMVNGRAATPKTAAANDLHANLYIAGTLTAAKDVILLQNGAVSTPDLVSGKMASGAPGADAYGIYAVGAISATNGSVIMAQNGKVESKAGSAAGIRANGTITGKIGVDIYNGGAVTANQTATTLTVSANGVQLLGAVSTGGLLAANNLSLNNNGDIAANNLTNAVVLGLATTAMDAQAKKDAATAFNTAATNAANAEIAGATPGAGAKITVAARDYLIGTADQKKAAVAAFVAHYLANNEAVLADIAARKGALVLAGKSVTATGVNAAAALTSGNVTVANNGTVTGGFHSDFVQPNSERHGLAAGGRCVCESRQGYCKPERGCDGDYERDGCVSEIGEQHGYCECEQ